VNPMEFRTTWFGFELNHLQSTLLLALAFIGLLNIPFGLLVGINELLDAIFSSIPAHIAYPSMYTIYLVFDDLKSSIVTIMMYLSFFILCLYTILKIIKNKHKSIFKHPSSQDQRINWFGFKLNHFQSILMFLLSLISIIWISVSFIRGLEVFPYSIFFNALFPDLNRNFQRALFTWMHLTIFIIFLYSIVTTKISSKRSRVDFEWYHPTSAVFTFIVSLMFVIFMIFKLLTLLYISMSLDDLIIILVVLFISTNLMSFSFLRKIFKPHYKQISISSTEPAGVTGKKAKSSKIGLIVLLGFIYVFIVFFIGFATNLVIFEDVYPYHFFFDQVLYLILGPQAYVETTFTSLASIFSNFLLFSIPFFIIFYCLIGRQRLERELKELELEIDEKWMGLHVKIKSHTIILFWISLAQLVFLLTYLYALFPYLYDPFSGTYVFFKTLLLAILIVVISVFCCYNIEKFYFVQKLREGAKSIKNGA
jgi:hypothetical protein